MRVFPPLIEVKPVKTLTLLRHAKSGWDDPTLRDFDRTLSAKGRRAAQAIGRHLQSEGARFDRVLASPAQRVVETIAEIEAGYGAALSPAWDKRVYLASSATLLDLVRETGPEFGSLLVIGHNPGLEDLVLLLVPGAQRGLPRRGGGEIPDRDRRRADLRGRGLARDRAGRGDADAVRAPAGPGCGVGSGGGAEAAPSLMIMAASA